MQRAVFTSKSRRFVLTTTLVLALVLLLLGTLLRAQPSKASGKTISPESAISAATNTAVPRTPRAKSPKLQLGGYQDVSGLIGTFKNGRAADPYFGLYALDLAAKGGLDVRAAQALFIEWGLREQKADGRFERYCKDDAGWRRCGRTDSDDATLARWVLLLHTAANGVLPPTWQASADRALTALLALRMKNGVYSVFPHDTPGYRGYALFKDNVEVLSAFEQLGKLYLLRGEHEKALPWRDRATRLRSAMAREFGDEPFAMKRLALGASYRGWQFYPHAVSIPFGWLEDYYTAPTTEQWARWLAEHRAAWYANGTTDFPWGLMALAALRTAPGSLEPHCWLAHYTTQRASNTRWNVLEEVAAQVIEQIEPSGETPGCPSSPRVSTSDATNR
jgi:hypothetical protein